MHGSVALNICPTFETVDVIRLRGAGRVERIGSVMQPITQFSASSDLKRAVVVGTDYHGDVWLNKVVRP